MIISKEQMARARVLVVGDVMLDRYWYGAVDRISPEAPVPVVRVTREEERNGGAALAASEGATLGSILCDHFLATRPALLVTTAGRVTLADGASIPRATVREMTGNELSSNGRFGLILNAASGALTRNRGAGNLFGLGNYAPAGVTVDDAAAIRGRSPPPAALPAVALDP